MESELVNTIIQGGGIGISVALIILIGWKERRSFQETEKREIRFHEERKMLNQTLNNHLSHINDMLIKHTEGQKGIAKAIDNNTRIMERLERYLDHS